MIKLENITKKYGNKTAVDGLCLEIPQGELFAFIGPNGAGKTTTVKMITGLLRPTSGKITVDNKNIHIQKEYIQAKKVISYIPDQPYTYDKLSGREFLRFMANIYEIKKRDFERDFDKYVEMFKMSGYIDELLETYSLGMKQRLIISASFIHQPKIIIVDEPLVGLDPASTKLVKDLFKKEVKENNLTIFMSTHLLSVAEETATKIGLINHGKLITLGTLEELKQRSKHEEHLEDIFMNLTQEKEC